MTAGQEETEGPGELTQPAGALILITIKT